jgi:hypothetical protein
MLLSAVVYLYSVKNRRAQPAGHLPPLQASGLRVIQNWWINDRWFCNAFAKALNKICVRCLGTVCVMTPFNSVERQNELIPWSRLFENLKVAQLVKKLPIFLWNPKVPYRVQSIQPPVPFLSLLNPIHNFKPCFTISKTQFSIICLSALKSCS